MSVKPRRGRWLLIVAVLGLVALVAFSGLYRVNQGEQALVLTFGEVTDTKGPGLYWHVPLIQNVVARSVTAIHDVEYGYRTTVGASRNNPAEYVNKESESVMLTNDNSIVQMDAIYQYTIRDLKQYLFNVADPSTTMHLAFEAILRRNVQNRSLDEALLDKDSIERQVLPDFQALLDSYGLGVKVHGVHIQNIAVPQAVTANYEDVNNAKNEKTRRLDEAQQYANKVLPLARSDAYQLTQQASAYKAKTIAEAQAEVSVFRAVYEKYKAQPEVSRTRMMIETIEQVLGGAGKIIIVDENKNMLQMLTLNGGTMAAPGGVQ